MLGKLTIFGMLLTVAAVLVLAYFCTRYLAGRRIGLPKSVRGKGQMRVIDQIGLGKDQRLVLVAVGERYLLLGVSPSSITQLSELTAEEAACWQQEQSEKVQAQSQLPSFWEAFQEAVKRNRK